MSNEVASPNQDKKYNYVGIVHRLVVRQDKSGKDWVAFKLMRLDGTKVECVAFVDKAAQFLGQFAEGATAKVFGFHEKRSFTGQDGKELTGRRFKLLWSGNPRSRDAATEAPAGTQVESVIANAAQDANPLA